MEAVKYATSLGDHQHHQAVACNLAAAGFAVLVSEVMSLHHLDSGTCSQRMARCFAAPSFLDRQKVAAWTFATAKMVILTLQIPYLLAAAEHGLPRMASPGCSSCAAAETTDQTRPGYP